MAKKLSQFPAFKSAGLWAAIVAGGAFLLLRFWYCPWFMDRTVPFYDQIHTILEIFSVCVSGFVFAVGWNEYREEGFASVLLLASGFLVVAILDLFHALSAPKFPALFTLNTVQKSITFWLFARLVESITLIAAAASTVVGSSHPYWRARWLYLAPALVIASALTYVGLFHMDWMPVFFVEGVGLMPAKIGAEYGIVALNLIAAVIFLKAASRRNFSALHIRDLLIAIPILCISEVCFTRYKGTGEYYNLVGHVLKVVGFIFIYRAVFISSLKEPFERLIQTQRELTRAVGSRDEFLAIASHELKTPLTAAKLQVQFLLQLIETGKIAKQPELQESLLRALNQEIDRYNRLADDLLDVSRLQTGKFRLRPSHVDLREIVNEVTEQLRPQLQSANCTLEVHLPETTISGDIDPLRIRQVLANLLGNIVKYARGSLATVSLSARGEEATLKVQDSGPGISAKDQSRIFDRFERAASRDLAGLGLGLYISRQIILAHHGTISLESAPGAGATFTIVLPLRTLAKEA